MGILDFFTGGGEYADPNAIDERYGVSKGDVRQAALNTLGNVSGLLLAAGQPMSGSQRAQLLGQLGPAFGGAQTDIYNAAQRRLLGAENEQKMAEMQRVRAFAERVKNDPEGVARELGTTADVVKKLTTTQLQTIAANQATAAINVTPGERAMREALAKISPTVSQGEALAAGGGGPTNKAQSLFGQNKTQAQLIEQYNEVIPKLIGQGYVKEAAELAANLKAMAPAAADRVTVPAGSTVIDKATGEVIYAAAAEPKTVTLSPGQRLVSSTGETITEGPAEQQDRPITDAERIMYKIQPDVPAVMTKTGPKMLSGGTTINVGDTKAPTGYEWVVGPDGKMTLAAIKGGPATTLPADLAARVGIIDTFNVLGAPQIDEAIKNGSFANDNYTFRLGLASNTGEAANIYRQFELGQEAIRRSLSGAALTESEVKDYAARYLPKVIDSEETIKSKYRDLKMTINAIKDSITSGRATKEDLEKIFKDNNPEAGAAIPAKDMAAPADLTDDELILKYGGN
jgi:hypothetical protein